MESLKGLFWDILFIIFINEISEFLISLSELYADDTKLMKAIRTPNDIRLLQEDINKIVKWNRNWLMKLNESKCKVMHIGGKNENHSYTIESFDGLSVTALTKTTLERDLGILISSDLKWKSQITSCANKASKIQNIKIYKAFPCFLNRLLILKILLLHLLYHFVVNFHKLHFLVSSKCNMKMQK